jgi:hypothetical protein
VKSNLLHPKFLTCCFFVKFVSILKKFIIFYFLDKKTNKQRG